MCGIVGTIGERNVTPFLVEGLKRLEYRGYDSAGLAVGTREGIERVRSLGKLVNLEASLGDNPVTGFAGIGHTRWATHGAPTEANAHPHLSERVAVVHNGIIENYKALREELGAAGVVFQSETDTEVIPHLIEKLLDEGVEPVEAVRKAVSRLEGAFALGILIEGHEEILIAARRGSPLIVGLGEGENFIASDATPLVPYTRRMLYLQDDDVAVLTRGKVDVTDLSGEPVARVVKTSQVSAEVTEKWPYRHYMQKEIFEQPTAVGETLRNFISPVEQAVTLGKVVQGIDLSEVKIVRIVACGTSWHAGMVGKYWIEHFSGMVVSIDIASEFRYREPPMPEGALLIVISQSGETADTLAALRFVKEGGGKVLGIVNVPESSIAREADAVLYTEAGPEIGVASTKAFTTQLAVMACLGMAFGKVRGRLTLDREAELVSDLVHLPARIEQLLTQDEAILALSQKVMHASDFLFLGRGTGFPIALEGALKLKEISYIHAEGYAAGEMKHGPIALIDEDLPVVVVAPRDGLFEKVVSNLEEVKARGGIVVMVTSASEAGKWAGKADYVIPVPECGDFAAPILYVVPLQMLAYHVAVLKGTDVDQPRNLAKSVTVE